MCLAHGGAQLEDCCYRSHCVVVIIPIVRGQSSFPLSEDIVSVFQPSPSSPFGLCSLGAGWQWPCLFFLPQGGGRGDGGTWWQTWPRCQIPWGLLPFVLTHILTQILSSSPPFPPSYLLLCLRLGLGIYPHKSSAWMDDTL